MPTIRIQDRLVNPKHKLTLGELTTEQRSLLRILKSFRDPNRAVAALLKTSGIRFVDLKKPLKKIRVTGEYPKKSEIGIVGAIQESLDHRKASFERERIEKQKQALLNDHRDDEDDILHPKSILEEVAMHTIPTSTTIAPSTISPIISDHELEEELDEEIQFIDFWPHLVEELQLYLTIQNRKSTYEVYRLAGRCVPILSADSIATLIRNDCLNYSEDCRVYATFQDLRLWLQIYFDFDPKKNIIAMITPDLHFVALTGDKNFIPHLIPTLDNIVTCNVATTISNKEKNFESRKMMLSGLDPLALVADALDLESRSAVGRFAHAARQNSNCPISELHEAATSNLFSLKTKATSKSHKDETLSEEKTRTAKRSCEVFGGKGDLPKRTCMRWNWKGSTAVLNAHGGNATTNVPSQPFTCRLTMRGSNVLEGLRELMEGGYTKDSLPSFVQNAPSLGERGIISINNEATVNGTGNPLKK